MNPILIGALSLAIGATIPDASTDLIKHAKSLLGVRYVWGGSDDSGVDCSGFIQLIHKRLGINIPRLVTEQYHNAPRKIYVGGSQSILWSEILPGDMIGIDPDGVGRFTHVYLYIGGGQIIHASGGQSCPHGNSRCRVVEDKLSSKIPSAWRGIYSYVNS